MNKTLSKEYTPAKLYLEDLEEIEAVLKSADSDFKIRTEDFEFNSVSEFATKYANQTLVGVKITIHRPHHISIDSDKLWVRMYGGSDDTASAGFFYKIDSILSSRLRQPNFLYSYWYFMGLVALANILPLGRWFGLACGLFLVGWSFWAGYIRMFRSGVVIVARKGDAKNFFARNADRIIVSIISVVLTTLAGALWPAFQEFIRSFPQS